MIKDMSMRTQLLILWQVVLLGLGIGEYFVSVSWYNAATFVLGGYMGLLFYVILKDSVNG